jgi:hypothetical protein
MRRSGGYRGNMRGRERGTRGGREKERGRCIEAECKKKFPFLYAATLTLCRAANMSLRTRADFLGVRLRVV